jgi:SOS-response transcriptional repressor LexA
MQTVGTIMRAHRQRLGLTLQALAHIVGCTKGYLSAIENDRREGPPSRELLEKIERALRMEEGSLVFVGQWQETPAEVRRRVLDLETERHMARRLARLLAREGIDRMHRAGELRRLVERLERDSARGRGDAAARPPAGGVGEVRRVLPVEVPVINKVAAGYPAEFTDLGYPARVADEYVSVPDPPGVNDPDAFAARVVGSSMEPEYREGDIVVFSPLSATQNGSDCFARFERNEESTFKRVYFEKSARGEELIRLQPLNPAFAARVVPREEVSGLYAAVYVVRAVGGGGA